MRLFVALDFPDTAKDRLLDLRRDIPTARWLQRPQLHLTLYFIGETEKNLAVQEALASVQAAPFHLTLAQVGRFPNGSKQAPSVLWAGVQPNPMLAVLQTRVTAALTEIGFQAETRSFTPHVTLARLKSRETLPAAEDFLEDHADFQIDPIPIRDFVLFSSTLSPEGAQYRREALYPLTAPAE